MRPASISNEFPSGLTSMMSPSSERTLRNPWSSSPITVALNDDLFGRSTVTTVLLVEKYTINRYYVKNINMGTKRKLFLPMKPIFVIKIKYYVYVAILNLIQ